MVRTNKSTIQILINISIQNDLALLTKESLQTSKLSVCSRDEGKMSGKKKSSYIMQVEAHFIVILWICFCKLAHSVIGR